MRYKEFNSKKVLEDSMTLFWNNGFGSCAINDIVKLTNVNRFSLYNEFENKEGILLHTLALYKERYSNHSLALLNKGSTIRTVLKTFFNSYLINNGIRPPGCYTIHIATELADSDDRIKQFLENYINQLETGFQSLLVRNEVTNESSQQIAKHLVGLFCNSMCFCVIQTPKEQHDYIDNCLDLILNKTLKHVSYTS